MFRHYRLTLSLCCLLALIVAAFAIVPSVGADAPSTLQLPMPPASMLDANGKLTQQALGALIEEGMKTGHMPAYALSVYPARVSVATSPAAMLSPEDDLTCLAWSHNIYDDWESETVCPVPVHQSVASTLWMVYGGQWQYLDGADSQCTSCQAEWAGGSYDFISGIGYLVSGSHSVTGWYPNPTYTADSWIQP